MILIPSDLIDLEEAPINFWEIEMKIREFCTLLNYDEDLEGAEIRMRVIEASACLNSARTLVKNLLMPEENEYIKEHLTSYYLMIENLSRADKRMDDAQKILIDYVENANLIRTEFSKNSKITSYERILKEFLDHLVYYPIKNAWAKFKKFNGKKEIEIGSKKVEAKIIKDEKLFLYFVFLELYHSSESLGGFARDQTRPFTSGKKASQTPGIKETAPPDITENVKTEDPISIPEELVEEDTTLEESMEEIEDESN